MAPITAKKKEKTEINDMRKSFRLEQLQTDYELFLQAFEKPTQIYRYLKTRSLICPIFLYRNLTYMKGRMVLRKQKVHNFHVDDMLKITMDKMDSIRGQLELHITGYNDKNYDNSYGPIEVDVQLVKISHKKRKEVCSPSLQYSVGKVEICTNSVSDITCSSNNLVLTLPTCFTDQENCDQIRSFVLVFRVVYYSGQRLLVNNDEEEPLSKKIRTTKSSQECPVIYENELLLFDRYGRCMLTDGKYELALKEILCKTSPKKQCSWEVLSEHNEKIEASLEVFQKYPILKFVLKWRNHPNGFLNTAKLHLQNVFDPSNKENNPDKENVLSTAMQYQNICGSLTNNLQERSRFQIYYQFWYNNNTRQQTEAREDLRCPWCSVNCLTLYSLLKHLKLCHSRFLFTYVPTPRGARIDVALNECYDGSYAGNPQDLVSQPPGYAFSRSGPVRRTVVFNIFVCHPQRQKPNLSEFLEDGEGDDNRRSFMIGHNRLYHHATTCLPIHPRDIDIDSEAENDPEWLQEKTQRMIDEFTDVNDGEKEFMKMWNLHILKYNYVGDCQIPLACSMFLEFHGLELLHHNLYRNFVLHMCNLYDFGLIPPSAVYQCIKKLQDCMSQDTGCQVFKESIIQQNALEKKFSWRNM